LLIEIFRIRERRMFERTVSGITLTLLFIGMLTLAFNIQPAEASGTIYIRADGSVDPSTAPISSLDNVTYTFADDINDSIVVERSNTVIDGDGYTLQGIGSGNGFSLSNLNNVAIKNARIEGFETAVTVSHSSEITIKSNNVKNNRWGIAVYFSSNNSVYWNNVTNNSAMGIDCFNSTSTNVYENKVISNYEGVRIFRSRKSTIKGNRMVNNSYNFDVGGELLEDFLNDIDASNLVNGKPVFYLVNQKHLMITSATHPQVGYLALVNSTNITVENLTLSNNRQGILLAYTNNSRIRDSNIKNNVHGICLERCTNNLIYENNVTENNWDGIRFCGSSSNSISENNVTSNSDGIGIYADSNNNVISGNDVTNNSDGIWLLSSNNNVISGNNLTNNIYAGITGYMKCNVFKENIIANNYYGVYLYGGSSNNSIYHNNFVNNTIQVYAEYSENFWDDGYPSGGNYWSDYDGSDADDDGIGDTPYIIDANNQDRYPLMKPWPSAETATININPHTLNLKSKGRWITAYIRLPEGYNVQEVNASTILLNGTILAEIHPMDIGDEDCDGIPELMVKFNRATVIEYILNSIQSIAKFANVTLTITGRLYNGTLFEGSDTIRVIKPVDKSPKGNQTPQETDTLVRQTPKPEFRMLRRRKKQQS
jgi:parallel beta-helix repeat protein